jgi:hypothetical protein
MCQNRLSSARFQALFGIETYPHGDIMDETCQRLDISEVQDVAAGTVETLIRKKVLYRRRPSLSSAAACSARPSPQGWVRPRTSPGVSWKPDAMRASVLS